MSVATGMDRQTEKMWCQNQSWHYEALYHYGQYKLKVDIRRNAYDFQSHLRVKIFDPETLKWNVLVSDAMTTERASHKISYTDRNPGKSYFRQDAEHLLAEAKLVLDN